MEEGFTCFQNEHPHSNKQSNKPFYLNFQESQEVFQLSSDEEVSDRPQQHHQKQNNYQTPSHKIHPAFQGLGSMKPSLFCSESIQQEYQCSDQAPKILEKQEKQKKQKKARRNTHCYQKKIFLESDNDEQEEQVQTQKRRKMTMQYQGNNDELLTIFPKTSKIRAEIKQCQKIKVQRQCQQDQEQPAYYNEQKLIGQVNQQLLYFDDSEDPKDPQESCNQKKKEQQNSNTLPHSQNQAIIQSQPSLQIVENILDPSEAMNKKQQDVIEELFNTNDSTIKHSFLTSGIEGGSRVVFQAVVENNNIFAREYSLWLDGGNQKMLLMEGKKYVKVTQDYYLINQYCDSQAPFNFVAKLQSNFMRRQLLLSNQPEYSEDQSKRIYGKFSVCSQTDGKPSIVAVFPVFDNLTRQQKIFNVGSNPESLKTLLRYRQSQITYISCCRLQQTYESHFKARNQLINTRKTMALIDNNGVIKVYIGKTSSKKYKIFAGSGISPLLAFAIFIVMIES